MIRRWPHSRVIVDGPSTTSIVGQPRQRHPLAAGRRRPGSRRSPRARRGTRSGSRTTSGKRSWPSMHFAHRLAAERLDEVEHRPGRRRRSGRLLLVDLDLQHRLAGDLLDAHVGARRECASSTRSISAAFAASTSRSSPKSLTARSARTPGDHLVDPHLDRLRERQPLARQVAQSSARSASTARPACCALLPLVARLERDEHVGQLDAHRVGGDLGRADAAPDVLDLVGKLREQRLLHLRVVADRLVQIGARPAGRR